MCMFAFASTSVSQGEFGPILLSDGQVGAAQIFINLCCISETSTNGDNKKSFRLGERRNSDESRKKRSLEQETHSAVDFSSTADTE